MSLWRARWGLVMATGFILTGCFSWGGGDTPSEDMTPHYYVVDVDRGVTASQFVHDRVLLLKPVKVVPHFRDKTLVFRVGENEYQPQPPHEFFIEPGEMMTSQLQRWLQKSGLFSQVIVDDSVAADYVLESAVTALYAEKRPAYSPQAVLEMQFFLTDAQDEKNLLFQTGLRVDADIDAATPGYAVKGWKQGLEELLATLEMDFSGFFSKLDAR